MPTDIHHGPQMIDITAPSLAEIQIRSDGAVLWINVDGVCRLRICGLKPANLILNDERTIIMGSSQING
jgi:hypothetical protein